MTTPADFEDFWANLDEVSSDAQEQVRIAFENAQRVVARTAYLARVRREIERLSENSDGRSLGFAIQALEEASEQGADSTMIKSALIEIAATALFAVEDVDRQDNKNARILF